MDFYNLLLQRKLSGGGGGGGDSNTAFKAFVSGTLTNITADMLEGCTAIGKYTFYHYESLRSVNIPESVTTIGEHAFDNCTYLTSVTIPNSVITIGEYAFRKCKLYSINIPNSVTTIAAHAFRECTNLRNVMIENGVTTIGENAFYGCTSLTSVTVKATTPPSCGFSIFGNTNNSFVIYVPTESVDAYKAATNWSKYASKIQAIPAN